MASASDADATRGEPQGGEEEPIGQGSEQRDVAPVDGEASAERKGHAGERMHELRGTNAKKQRVSAASISQGLMRAIRSKHLWQDKLGNETIVNKYKREVIEQGIPRDVVEETIKHLQVESRQQHLDSKLAATSASSSSETNLPASPIQLKKPVSKAELRDLIDTVAAVQSNLPITLPKPLEEPDCGVAVVDNVVPKMLREILESSLDAIADLPAKDFHPKSKKQVQDLIHPSLFPYIEGVSPLLVEHSTLPPRVTEFQYFKRPYEDSKYQWLPSQFYVDASGSVEIRSYINNLERKSNRALYKAIELMFGIFLPMFEKLLSKELRSRELQVIVKAANYIIRPKDASYEGTWHVEGMTHEQIVASGIYYYSTSPWLEDHGLEFRRPRDEDKDWPQTREYQLNDYIPDSEQDDDDEIERKKEMYAKLTQKFYNNIYLGAVPTLQDRLLVFRNDLQHKVSKLENNSEHVGTRKILVFFLVDPDYEIVSTKHVPEQQAERRYPALSALLSEASMSACGKKLPSGIELDIATRASRGEGITLAEAKRHRRALMKEREAKKREDNEEWEEEYGLCEH